MRNSVFATLCATLAVCAPTLAGAASLQVAPINVEIPAPGASTTIKLRNEGSAPLNAQIRVFRWTQKDGEEKLEPTDDVVASPPIATLAAKADYVVRLVRLSKAPIAEGASYRLLVDELPDPARQKNGNIAIVLRYSIPVFFYKPDAAAAKLTWSVTQRNGHVYVSAKNDGDRHVRLAGLKLQAADGTVISFGEGLTGYVLGHSTMGWTAANNNKHIGTGASVAITAQSDAGPISASPIMQPAR